MVAHEIAHTSYHQLFHSEGLSRKENLLERFEVLFLQG